jgi:type I restriction enzyme, S subunit
MKFKYSSSWTTSLLDDVTDRGSGHTPSQSSPEYWNGQIKWVSLADSSKLDNLFISNTDKTISELGIKNSSAVKHPAGTVILSRDAGVGKSAILKEEMAVSQHFIVWKCSSKNIIHNIYLYYWLQMMKHEFERMAVGSTIKTIGLPYFKKLEITYPPLLEQCRIAEMLGVWDESIDLLERLIGRTRSRKQGLMQQLLTGKKRFKEFESSEWTESKFSEVTTYSKGYTYKSEEYSDVETNTYLITLKCIGKGGGFQDSGLKYFDDKINSKFEVFEGDLLFANTDLTRDAEVVGSPILMPHLKDKRAMISMDLTKVTIVKEKIHKPFLYYLMKSSSIRNSFRAMASGSTVLHLDTNGTKKISLNLPSLPEQEKIAAVLSAADEEISTLEKQLAAYKQQKLGLMQQLLTGKIRVG